MQFNNKVRVTKENQRLIENMIGEKCFIGDIVYLESSDLNEVEKEPLDLLSFLYQETTQYLLLWDEDYGMNVDANLLAFSPKIINELEKDIEGCILSNYGDCN
jgi:hypothetical protein